MSSPTTSTKIFTHFLTHHFLKFGYMTILVVRLRIHIQAGLFFSFRGAKGRGVMCILHSFDENGAHVST